MLIDVGGNDEYRYKEGNKPGMAIFDERFKNPQGLFSTFFSNSTSIGLFLDAGGVDKYSSKIENNTFWTDPKDSPNWEVRNFSIGWDCPTKNVELLPIPEKVPSAK